MSSKPARRKQAAPSVATKLLAWYDRHARTLPWRYRPGETPDPYRVWLSEIMLQQTSVAAVRDYFLKFTAQWPTVQALAAAPTEDVMRLWAGLGYYSRARNLHAAAKTAVAEHGGAFPDTEAALRTLPGIGPYTAAAIAAIAFGRKASPMDGNIERVTARLFAVETPLPTAKPELQRLSATLTPETRAGDFAQALMDLGSSICTPKSPACVLCPLLGDCAAQKKGIQATLPRRADKPERPHRTGAAFVLISANDKVLIRRRPTKGLLGGMLEIPSTPWTTDGESDPLAHAPIKTAWTKQPTRAQHVFTHFALTLDVYVGRTAKEDAALGLWVPVAELDDAGLPTVMRKIAAATFDDLGRRRR